MTTEFEAPQFDCDLILKGGITSGIVYPPAIAQLARSHRFHSIAGASAGAIGAAAAAAAEVGRHSETGGFGLLETLPVELSGLDDRQRTKLFRLFQPQPSTRPFFEVVWEARQRSGLARVTAIARELRRHGPGAVFVVALVGALALGGVAVTVGLAIGGAGSLGLSIPLAVLLLALAVLVGGGIVLAKGAVGMVDGARAALKDNFHGFVNGATPSDSDDPALTDWLYDAIQRLAGRNDESQVAVRSVPVTHGEVAAAGAEFVAITTNLSRGTSDQVPFRERIWAFDPDEFRRLFPADVVDHMVRHADTDANDDVLAALGPRLRLLPAPEDLPIIVAARMSLSFPVLLSAVPLYGLTPRRIGDTWRLEFVRNWFSDGGITSNLPVHLFDRPLPTWPTYAINLGGGGDRDRAPHDNISRPIEAGHGRMPSTAEIPSTLGLLGAVFDTMQNWADNDLTRVAGFRERICTIRLGDGEGGMNLDMPPERIAPLVDRGRCAGRNLASMRTGELGETGIDPSSEADRQWDRHRWTRYRIAGAGLGRFVSDVQHVFEAAPTATTPSYLDLGGEAARRPSPLPYASDWSQRRNDDVVEIWRAVFALGGHPVDRFGDGPAGVGLNFAASADPQPVAPKPPVAPE